MGRLSPPHSLCSIDVVFTYFFFATFFFAAFFAGFFAAMSFTSFSGFWTRFLPSGDSDEIFYRHAFKTSDEKNPRGKISPGAFIDAS
jgi:hypothetical protein